MRLFFTIISVLFFQLSMIGQVITENLKLYLPFNGNSIDESENQNDGMVFGANLAADRFGNLNSAYAFDGLDDYIVIMNNNLEPLTDGTISFWFSPENNMYSTSNHQIFMQSDINGDDVGHFILGFNRTNCFSFPSTEDGKINFELQGDFINNNSLNCPTYGLTRVSTSTDFWESNQWYNITTIIESGEIKIYVNGIHESTQSTNSAIFVSGLPITLGRFVSFQQSSAFNGLLDDILVYDRALDQNEIDSIVVGNTSGVNSLANGNLLELYPNPIEDVITIISPSYGCRIILTNSLGKKIMAYTLDKGENQISLKSKVPKGFYFAQLFNSEGTLVGVKKIIRN